MNLTEAATFLSQQWPCFPCNADKRPVTAHGLKDASMDLAEVREMFRRPGAAMIGVPTGEASGFFVVDLDLKEGASGLEWLAANEHRMPRTRRHRTRSGGVHLLFLMPAGRAIRNSASKLAPGVDVRGSGGYVIVPPSPGYAIADDAMPATAPAWLLDLIDPPRAAEPAPAPRRVREDGRGTPYALAALSEECDAILAAGFGSQESTLNAAALKLGALAGGGEIDAAYAREALISAGMGMPSQGGREPWTHQAIRDKVERAFRDGQARPRNAPPREVRHTVRVEIIPPEPPPRDEAPEHWAMEPEIIEHTATQAREADEPSKPALRWSADAWSEAAIPPRPWVVRGYMLRGSVTLAAGAGSAGKSSLMVAWSVACALGADYGRFRPHRPLRVLTYNVEDDEDEQQRRMSAALRQFGATPRDLGGNVMRVGPAEIGTLIEHDVFSGKFRFTDAWHELERLLAEFKPDVILLDPLAELHTAEENNNTALRHVLAYVRSMAKRHNCAAVVIHHIRKGGEAGDMDAVRGAGSLVGAARTVFTVTPMSKEEAEEFGIQASTRRSYFRLDNAKANYVEAGEAEWHELQGFDLDNGENVAAALPWTPPNMGHNRPGVAPDALALVHAEIARGTAQGPWSPRLAPDQPRSVSVLLARHGITEPRAQKDVLKKLLADGCTVQEFTDGNRIRRSGLRAAGGGPFARWCSDDVSGAHSDA